MSRYNDYSLVGYGAMVADSRRTAPYVEALRRVVRPGDVVLDIGTGSGIFAFIACQLGAARVYAIELDDVIDVAKRCVADNPGSERIVWLKGMSTELELPEKVDVVIGDLHGTLPFFKGNIDSLADARRRHLKPGGRMIPARDLLRAAPAQAPDEYQRTQTPWIGNEYGVDLRAARPFVVNEWWRADRAAVAPENLLAEPVTWGVIDYLSGESSNPGAALAWVIAKAGTLHGYYLWFDGEFGDGIAQTNTPLLEAMAYGRSFFPLEQAIEVQPGDKVSSRFSMNLVDGEDIYRWDTRITDADGVLKADFKQSTLKSRPFNPPELKRAVAEFVPILNDDGQIEHAILAAMAQSQPLGQIAADLVAQFPKRFPDAGKALKYVARLSMRYSH
jgi:protein arginine N-methyltransferase 1